MNESTNVLPVKKMDGQRIDCTSSFTTNNKKRRVELTVVDGHLQELRQQWFHQDEGALVVHALSFLDVKILLQMECFNKTWRQLCEKTIDDKCGHNGPKAFQSNQELRDAVENYCMYEVGSMEEIACTYGYPIDKWNVSQVEDMSSIFSKMKTFNEYIGSWDVSSVKSMNCMFLEAHSFNHDLGSWDV
jgi:Mycoplasma protein of unknown function, DUF285